MTKYNLLNEILSHLTEYEQKSDKPNIEEFSIFLKDKVLISKEKNKTKIPNFLSSENFDYTNFIEVQFSILLTNLYRFAKHYLKKAFKGRLFNTIDEFGFLATLVVEKNLLKSELINRHLLEISTGSEVLRRLIKNKLIYEFADTYDGRAKRVALTEKGFKEITSAFEEMYKVSQIVKGNLSEEEIKEAICIFKKLSFYHWDIHEHDKDTELEQIYRKYANTKK